MKRLSELFVAWWRLDGEEKRQLLAAAGLLPVVFLALRLRGLAACLHWLEARQPGEGRQLSSARAVALALAVRRASRYVFPPASCLTQALVLHYMLSRAGATSVLRIGVRREGEGMRAHAWVEHAGLALLESPEMLANYRPLSAAELAK